ncbi:hypothetical protein [Kitasatospora sp. NPDC002040]|uniref:hypothetical protein n=1 Tax=Kitasatospora sp. NPDC002040 TaxID=3154661 RepID=UPI00331EDA72
MNMLDRLSSIAWNDAVTAEKCANSRSALMAEYLRRMALWASAYEIGRPWPFIDLVEHIDPSVRIGKDVLDRIDDLIEDRAIGPKVARVCRNAVRWAELRGADTAALPDIADPFEPIIVLLERGGQFFTEGGIALLGFGGVPLAGVAENISRGPLERLDSDCLDELDAS